MQEIFFLSHYTRQPYHAVEGNVHLLMDDRFDKRFRLLVMHVIW